MKNLLVGFLAIIFISLAVQAQVVSNYGGETIQDTANGYSFTAPNAWNIKKGESGYILTTSDKTAGMVVKPHTYNDFDAFVAAEVNLESGGYQLAGQVRDLGNGNRFARVYNSTTIIDAFFLLSSYNGGVVVFSVTNNATTANQNFYVAAEIVKSVQFLPPQQTEQGSQYDSFFAGKKLTAVRNSTESVIWLCPSGTYSSQFQAFYSSGSTFSEDQGTWRVQNSGGSVYLILSSQTGEGQTNYEVTQNQGSSSVSLNGKSYLVEQYNGCR